MESFCPDADPRMVNIWRDLREVVRAINLADQTKRPMDMDIFQQTSISILYRLFHLDIGARSRRLDGIVRLAMIVFAERMHLHVPTIGLRWDHMIHQFEQALESVKTSGLLDAAPEEFLVWLFFVSKTLPVFATEDFLHWMNRLARDVLAELGLESWAETRIVLKKYLWIDTWHDELGKQLFQEWTMPPCKESEDRNLLAQMAQESSRILRPIS
jgi:hypothetical protein